MRHRGGWVITLLAATVATAGCGKARGSASAAVRDSAGVRVVENRGRAWSSETAWRAGAARLHVGGHDVAPEYQLYQVRGATRLPDGRVVVAANGSHDLRYYGPSGRFLKAVGRQGEGPGEFGGIWQMTRFAHDSLLIWDNRNMRLSVHALEGTFVRSFKLQTSQEGVARFPGAELVPFSDGSLLGLEWLAPQLMDASPGVVRPTADYFLFDREGREISPIGSFPWIEFFVGKEQFTMPNGRKMAMRRRLLFGRRLHLAAGDSTFWMGSGSATLSLFDSRGRLLQRVRRADLQRSPVTQALLDREMRLRLTAAREMGMDPSQLARRRRLYEAMPVADTLPAYEGMLVDTEGNLWVRHHPGVQNPNDPRPSSWDVFRREGRYLGSVQLPPRFEPFEVGADYVLGVQFDELDIERLILLPLVKPMQEQ